MAIELSNLPKLSTVKIVFVCEPSRDNIAFVIKYFEVNSIIGL